MNKKAISMLISLIAGALLCLGGTTAGRAATVKDQLGRSVSVPDNPQRVVALAPSVTEIIFSLGQAHRLKGVTQFSNYPPAAKKIPLVGSYVHLEVERIVALRPDLCIGIKSGNPLAVVKKLERLGIPVFAVNPEDLGTVAEAVSLIGGVLGAREQARALVRDMRKRIEHVRAQVKKSRRRPGVFFQIGIAPIVCPGTRSFIHELIETAGGENLTRGPVPYPRFSREQVLALAPEVMIITSMARTDPGSFEKIKNHWRTWKDIPAVRTGRIHVVDSDIFDRPGPRMIEGLEILARLLHPKGFENE